MTLPGSSFLVLPPHTFERLRSSTRRDSTTRPNTAISTYTTPRDVVQAGHVHKYQTSLTCSISLQPHLLHSSIYHVARACTAGAQRRDLTPPTRLPRASAKAKATCRGQGHARGFRSTLRSILVIIAHLPSPEHRTRTQESAPSSAVVPSTVPSTHTPVTLHTLARAPPAFDTTTRPTPSTNDRQIARLNDPRLQGLKPRGWPWAMWEAGSTMGRRST